MSLPVGLNRPGSVLAIILMGLLLCKAWVDVDWYWDTWLYHLPFAGWLWGLIPEGSYVADGAIQDRFEGFALLAHWVMGALWWLTGQVQATNLLSVASLLALVVFLNRRYQLPLFAGMIGLLAIPLVQIHATLSHVDLPGNVCLTIAFLLVIERWSQPYASQAKPATTWQRDGLMAVMVCVASNIKLAFLPLSVGFWLAYRWPSLSGRSFGWHLLGDVIVIAIACATVLKNTWVYGEPFHAVAMAIGPWVISTGESFDYAVPDYLKHAPNLWRWVLSVLEVGRPFGVWSWDQHGVEGFTLQPNYSSSNTMGGYNVAYVLCLLAGFWVWLRQARQEGCLFSPRVAGVAFLVLTVVFALLPMSHHLRYYSVWMMSLVSLTLMGWWGLARQGLPLGVLGWRWVMTICVLAFGLVVWATQGEFLWPQGRSLSVVQQQVLGTPKATQALAAIREPGTYCLHSALPFALLYSQAFHPQKPFPYTVEDAGWPPTPLPGRDPKAWPLSGLAVQVSRGACGE